MSIPNLETELDKPEPVPIKEKEQENQKEEVRTHAVGIPPNLEKLTNVNRSLKIFRRSKEIFLQEFEHRLENTKPIPRKYYQYAKCLLVDSNAEIAKKTLEVLTKALKGGDIKQADYILDVGIPYFPMVEKKFAKIDLDSCLQFFVALLTAKPMWVISKMLNKVVDLISKSVLSSDPGIVNHGFVMLHRLADNAPYILFNETTIIQTLIEVLAASQTLYEKQQGEIPDSSSWLTFYTKRKLDIKLGHPELFSNLIITLTYVCEKLPKLDENTEKIFQDIYLVLWSNPFKLTCKKHVLRLITALVQKSENMNTYIFKNEGNEVIELGLMHKDTEIRTLCDNLCQEFAKYADDLAAFQILIQNLKTQIESNPGTFLENPSFLAVRHLSEADMSSCNLFIALGLTEVINIGLNDDAWQLPCFELATFIGSKSMVLANRMTEKYLIHEISKNFNKETFVATFPGLLRNIHYVEPIARLFEQENVQPVENEIRTHLMSLMTSRGDVFQKEHLIMARYLTVTDQEKVAEFIQFIHSLKN